MSSTTSTKNSCELARTSTLLSKEQDQGAQSEWGTIAQDHCFVRLTKPALKLFEIYLMFIHEIVRHLEYLILLCIVNYYRSRVAFFEEL